MKINTLQPLTVTNILTNFSISRTMNNKIKPLSQQKSTSCIRENTPYIYGVLAAS